MSLDGHDLALAQVRALVKRLEQNPFWMFDPKPWIWRRPDGKPQGFGLLELEHVGMINMLWLSLDMDKPPPTYESSRNPLYMEVFLNLQHVKLKGLPLGHMASICTLRQFYEALPDTPPVSALPLERALPLLKLMAGRRLNANS